MKALDYFLGLAIAKMHSMYVRGSQAWRGGTPSRQRPRNRDGLPSHYPGAKLARRAVEKTLTVRWP